VKALFSQLPRPTIDSNGAYFLLKSTLVVYLYCWFFGCNRDLSVKNDILHDAPNQRIAGVAITALILSGFGFLFYVENTLVLSTVFIIFLAVNIGAWVYLKRKVAPFADAAQQHYNCEGDVVAEVKTLIYKDYMFGAWQWWRFVVGFLLLGILTLIASNKIQLYGIPQDVTFAFVTAATIAVLEVWIWHRRLRLKTQWDGLDWLEDQGFIVAPKTTDCSNSEVV
jgi:hypothetical protein